jgi:hypothetical protein
VFSVKRSESRSSWRVLGSTSTFSSTVPNRRVVWKMSGSYMGERRIVFA